MIMERCTQEVIGSYEDAIAIEKEFDALEAKLGNVPAKRRYVSWYSGLPYFTYVWERDWENMAALDVNTNKIMTDPEWTAAFEKADKIFRNKHFELYICVDQ